MSRLCAKSGTVRNAKCMRLDDAGMNWREFGAAGPFVDAHQHCGDRDGIVYLGNDFEVFDGGAWTLRIGHDGGVAVFVDGKRVLCEPRRVNPALPWRSYIMVDLAKGRHEVVVALDTDHGLGYGMFFCFELPPSRRKKMKTIRFPSRWAG